MAQTPTQPPAGYRTQSEDTAYEVERLLIDAYRAMPAWEKARRVAEDCRALEALALAGLRARHASAGPEEIRFHLAVLRLGWDLAVAVYGNPFFARD